MSTNNPHTSLRNETEPTPDKRGKLQNEDIRKILRSWLADNERILIDQKNVGEFNGVMMQWFHWYTDDDGNHWNRLKEEAPNLAKAELQLCGCHPHIKE